MQERTLPPHLAALVVRLDGHLKLMAIIASITLFLLLVLALALIHTSGAWSYLYERFGPVVTALGLTPPAAALGAYRVILWACRAYSDNYVRRHLLS